MIKISDTLNRYLTSTTRLEGQYLRMVITTKSGVVYNISDEDLHSGSVKLNRKSVSGSSFDIGECYINDITVTLIDKNGKYSESLDNADLCVYFGVVNESLGLNEEIQIGRFIVPVDTTVRKLASIQINGDSVLSKFDLSTNSVSTSGDLYTLVTWCCKMCGVDFALTEDEFKSLSINTGYTYFISAESAISTYRDVIMYVSQLIGGFATDTNDGKLTFKTYNTDNGVFNINNDTIASSNLGDSAYYLDGLSLKFEDKIIYASGDASSDYLLELESNPLLDSLTEDIVAILLGNIWNQLKGIQFRSFTFSYNGSPALECGDLLSNDTRGISSFVTSLTWIYHGKSSVSSAFMDKRTKTQSQGVKKASTTGGSSSNTLNILQYINTKDYSLSQLETKVMEMYFTLPAYVSPLFTFVMICNNALSGLVSLRIVYDNVDTLLKPRYQNSIGYHTLSFSKSFEATGTSMPHSVSVYATFIKDENQETISDNPCSVLAYDIEANIQAWGIVSSEPEWTGRYELRDSVGVVTIDDAVKILEFAVNEKKAIEDFVPPDMDLTLLAKDATLSGTTVLRSNSNVAGGYDLDYLGDYPDNIANWSFTVTKSVATAKVSVKASSGDKSRSICLYIDGNKVVTDLSIYSGSYSLPTTVLALETGINAGEHTIAVSRGSTDSYAPLVASISIMG